MRPSPMMQPESVMPGNKYAISSLFATLLLLLTVLSSALPGKSIDAHSLDQPSTQLPAPNIISNGTIRLGVQPLGNLIAPGGTPSAGQGTTQVGIRYIPTNGDGVSPGCDCEGWGVA